MIQFTVNGFTSIHGRPAGHSAPVGSFAKDLNSQARNSVCGAGLCGACMVHIDGARAFSCQTQMSEVAGGRVPTIEELSSDSRHPVQRAWLAERVPRCGDCQSGQSWARPTSSSTIRHPTRREIVERMSTNICRCGTYQRIVRAVERAARET